MLKFHVALSNMFLVTGFPVENLMSIQVLVRDVDVEAIHLAGSNARNSGKALVSQKMMTTSF